MRFKSEKVLVSIYSIPKMQETDSCSPRRVVIGRKPEEGSADNREYWTSYFRNDALKILRKHQNQQGMCFGYISNIDIKPSVWNKDTKSLSNGYIIVNNFEPYNA